MLEPEQIQKVTRLEGKELQTTNALNQTMKEQLTKDFVASFMETICLNRATRMIPSSLLLSQDHGKT